MPGIGQLSAPNQSVEGANGVHYAYRRFGTPSPGTVPVVFLQHYRGNLDNWDPALIDPIAERHEVILVDNVGVGGSTGTVPGTVQQMALDALTFIDALGLESYDLFGFSLGGFVAQEIALVRPYQVRRIVLAGTGPQGGRNFHLWTGEVLAAARRDETRAEDLLTLFFRPTETSQAKGKEFIQRIFTRQQDRDAPTDVAVRDAQHTAISTWGIPDGSRLVRLAAIEQPVLAANGDSDAMVPTVNTHLLGGHLPNARVVIYPDSGHAFLFQYPAEFAAEVNTFLGE